jgi:hypothetical protein
MAAPVTKTSGLIAVWHRTIGLALSGSGPPGPGDNFIQVLIENRLMNRDVVNNTFAPSNWP